MLTVSALSYKTQTVKVDANTNFLEIKLRMTAVGSMKWW